MNQGPAPAGTDEATRVLSARYHRIFRLFPASYRRQRADEMVAVLVATAAPQQRRPSVGETSALLVLAARLWCRRNRSALIGLGITAVVLIVGVTAVWWFVGAINDELDEVTAPDHSSPPVVAYEFAAAYATGDVPKACSLAAGEALEKLQTDTGCDRTGTWTVDHWLRGQCVTAQREYAFVFDTSPNLFERGAFEIIVTGGAPSKVTNYLARYDPSLCDIYGGFDRWPGRPS